MARERRDAIAADMLREGWPAEAVLERFAGFEPTISDIRRRFGIPAAPPGSGGHLPAGPPVR
ncbi:hypothetical protein [Myxococcus eversor]|uniref:hypothetical protein n=1 Tax=Myxococcus eversor TaxID=2709661 RepID=UPI00196799F0|nr:hypothetical protein [Myxococcus eversor]